MRYRLKTTKSKQLLSVEIMMFSLHSVFKIYSIDEGRKREDSFWKQLGYFKLLEEFHYYKKKTIKYSNLTFSILFVLNIGLNPKTR